MRKVDQITTDFEALICSDTGNAGSNEEIRLRLVCNDGHEYVAAGYKNEDWRPNVTFDLELSPTLNSGTVSVDIKKADIECGKVRVDVFK